MSERDTKWARLIEEYVSGNRLEAESLGRVLLDAAEITADALAATKLTNGDVTYLADVARKQKDRQQTMALLERLVYHFGYAGDQRYREQARTIVNAQGTVVKVAARAARDTWTKAAAQEAGL